VRKFQVVFWRGVSDASAGEDADAEGEGGKATHNRQVAMAEHPAPDGSNAAPILILDFSPAKKPLKKERHPSPSLTLTESGSPCNWDKVEVHVDLDIPGKPLISFLMAEVKPNDNDWTKKELQPIDFKLRTFVEVFIKEAKDIMEFDEKVQFAYVDDLGPVTTSNPGSWPLILQRFMDCYERKGKILHLKVDHMIPPGRQAPITMLPHTHMQSLAEMDSASSNQTRVRQENRGISSADTSSSVRDAVATQPRSQATKGGGLNTLPSIRGLSIYETPEPDDTVMQQDIAAPVPVIIPVAPRPAAASKVVVLRSQKLSQIRVPSQRPSSPQQGTRPQPQITSTDVQQDAEPQPENTNDYVQRWFAAARHRRDTNEATQEWTDTDTDTSSDRSSSTESDSSQDSTYEEPASANVTSLSAGADRRSSMRIAKKQCKRKATGTPSPIKASPFGRPAKMPRR